MEEKTRDWRDEKARKDVGKTVPRSRELDTGGRTTDDQSLFSILVHVPYFYAVS